MKSRGRDATGVGLPHGILDLLVLQTLRWGPRHGYGIARVIRENSTDALRIGAGSLYPALHRLARRRFTAASWTSAKTGRRIRVYRLTPRGEQRLALETIRWAALAITIATLATPPIRD